MSSKHPPRSSANAPGLRLAAAAGPGDLASALAIREVVFIEEQRVPESLERDEEDAHAYHVIAYDSGHAIGTGRLIMLPEPPAGETGRWGRIGRMAVLNAYRGRGVGRAILKELEDEGRRRKLDGFKLTAQTHAQDFYVKAGYRAHGEVFMEAGIPHLEMRKSATAV